jgi:hypothetical protein
MGILAHRKLLTLTSWVVILANPFPIPASAGTEQDLQTKTPLQIAAQPTSAASLVVQPASPVSLIPFTLASDPSLVRLLARADEWYEWVLDGKVNGLSSISRLAGFSERYVTKVFQSALLAPDIVDAIIEGRQPPNLTCEKLCRDLPISWVEQRHQLGSPAHP